MSSASISMPSPPITMPSPPITIPSPPIMTSIPPPPTDTQYDTAESGIKAINLFAKQHGYAVAIRDFARDKNGVKCTVRLCCDHGRMESRTDPKHRSTTGRKRATSTKRIGCPFAACLRLRDSPEWALTIKNPTHNHDPSPASTHRIHRAAEIKEKAEILDKELQQGQKPRDILTRLRAADPDTCLRTADISQYRQQKKAKSLAGRTPVGAASLDIPLYHD